MNELEAEEHQVDAKNIEEYRFEQDKKWFATFKPNVEAFFINHLEWFYGRTFDTDQARNKVKSILTGVEKTCKLANVRKRQLGECF